MKLNKGEWGEPYAALKLLGEGCLHMADENGFRKTSEWMNVIELIRYETAERVVTYNRDPQTLMVEIDINGSPTASLPVSDFLKASEILSQDIKKGSGHSFDVSSQVNEFLVLAEMLNLKAKSVDKSDIFLTTLDPRSAITRTNIGFSIKSKFGQDPTLFNTAPASAVRYEVKEMTDGLMEKINALVDKKGHAAVSQRCALLTSENCKLEYVGYATAKRAKCEAFKENLDILDPRLPKVIEQMLWNHFFNGETTTNLIDVVGTIVKTNPCNVFRPEIKYPFMIKSFLYAAYCGMTASTLWNGKGDVNGGFITVDENGQILANYALESEEFKSYLYNNCYLEFPATNKKHGDYAYVYKEDRRYYFNLNFQIRYR